MRIIFKNSFHNTTAIVFAKPRCGNYVVSKRQYRRASKSLCPSIDQGCTCGVIRGGRYNLFFAGDEFLVTFEGGTLRQSKE